MLKYHTVSCFMWDFTGDQFFTNDLTSESAICWRVKGALSARDESVSHGMQVRSRFNELFLKHTETNKHPLERETELTWETAVMSAEELLLLMFNPKRSRPQRPNDARGRRFWFARSWRQLSHLRLEARQLTVPVPLTKLRWNALKKQRPFFPQSASSH